MTSAKDVILKLMHESIMKGLMQNVKSSLLTAFQSSDSVLPSYKLSYS
jgi:hypothetical protein